MSDDKIIRYDEKTKSYVNEKGEALKFTPNSMSVYSNTPDKPHDKSLHIDKTADPDVYRVVEKDGDNKTTQDIKCYLTTACMKHYMDEFDDNCYYLDILRWFRDNYISLEDKKEYYNIAPKVVETINELEHANDVYNQIYYKVIQVCVRLIEYGRYVEAYEIYKNNVLDLQNKYVKKLVLND